MMRELRNALRQLRRAPAFTLTAVVVLSLAIGAGAAVYALLDTLLLRELPVPSAGELVQVTTRDARDRENDLNWMEFTGLLDRQQAFSAVIGSISQGMVTMETAQGAVRASTAAVTHNYFQELGASPVLGRFFDPSEINIPSRDSAAVGILGWNCWQRYFGGNSSIIGQQVRVQGVDITVIGIAPREFHGLGLTIENDITVPITVFPRFFDAGQAWFGDGTRWVSTTGRLKSGTTLESARAQVGAIWPSLRQAATPTGLNLARRDDYLKSQIRLDPGSRGVERGLRSRYRQPLYALLAITILIVLLAALNVGSLAFVRAESARHELGIRLALGATRARVVREMTLQGLLVGAAGAVGAVLLAGTAAGAIAAFMLRDYAVPTSLDVSPGLTVILVTTSASLASGAAIMAFAAWSATSSTRIALTTGGNRSVARSSRLGPVLVAAQSALAVVVLANVSLLGANLQRLSTADPHFKSDDVLFGIPIERPGAYRSSDVALYYRDALARVAAVPGVSAAAFSQQRPQWSTLATERVGRTAGSGEREDVPAATTLVSPGFFATIGLPILQGRDFTYGDKTGSAPVVILTQRLASQLFGDVPAVGQRVRLGDAPDLQGLMVVGVTVDARVFDVRNALGVAYRPSLQAGGRAHNKVLVVRAPASAVRGIQQAIDSLGVETVGALQTLADARGSALRQERIMSAIGIGLGALALVLVAAGVYGLLAYVLSLSRKEMGIRMALGADAARIGRGMLANALRTSGIGMLVGLVAAVPAARLLRSVLTAIEPSNPFPIAGACAVLIVATLLAALGPARRAARLEPLVELRRD